MSVSKILGNMNLETFASLGECAEKGKEWLEEYKKTRTGPTKNSIELFFSALKNKENTLNALKNISNAVKKNQNLLIGVLSETLYTYYDAKATVDMFIDELTHYNYYFDELYSQDEFVPFQINFTVRLQEIPILGRIFCPALLSRSILKMQITDEECLPYLIVLKRIIDEAEFLTIPESKREQIDVACIEDFSARHYCPMLIFDDADLDSAVNALVSGTWGYQGKALWSFTHVYIQEAIYAEAIKKIKLLTVRFLKSNPYYFKHYENRTYSFQDERVGSLEIFQPNPNLPHRFFIGWDPRTYVKNPRYNLCELGLAVLPFRTDSEGIALVNNSVYSSASSIWTERIARANLISKKLDMGTVWVNCHGLIKPEIPFESRKQSKIPFNGLKLLQLLQMPKGPHSSLPPGNFKINETNIELTCGTMNEVLNQALQASSELNLLDVKSLWSSLSPLIKQNSQIYESNGISKDKFKLDHTVKSYNDLKADAVCWKESNKVILYEINQVTDESLIYLCWFVYCSIGLRNSIIIVASSDDVHKLQHYECFKLLKIPKGSINFVPNNIYKPRDLIENSWIRKQIILSEYDAKDVSLNHMGYLTKMPNFCGTNSSMLEVFLVGVKTVWWPY